MLKNKDFFKITAFVSFNAFAISFLVGSGLNLSDMVFEANKKSEIVQLESKKYLNIENDNKFNFPRKLNNIEANSNDIADAENEKVLREIEKLSELSAKLEKNNERLVAEMQNANVNLEKQILSKKSGKYYLGLVDPNNKKEIDNNKENKTMDVVSKIFENQKADEPIVKNKVARVGYDAYGNKLTVEETEKQVMTLAKNLPMDLTINYLAFGEEKGQIFVFSDPSCPYCRKLHSDIPKLTKMGFTVRHLFFPRGGLDDTNMVNKMMSAWCTSTQQLVLDDLYSGNKIPEPDCSALTPEQKAQGDVIGQHYMLAAFFNAKYTPTVFASNGGISEGYRDAITLLKRLGYM